VTAPRDPQVLLFWSGDRIGCRILLPLQQWSVESRADTAEAAAALAFEEALRVADPVTLQRLPATIQAVLERWRRPCLEGTTKRLRAGQSEVLTWQQPVTAQLTGELEFESPAGLQGWLIPSLVVGQTELFCTTVPVPALAGHPLIFRQTAPARARVTMSVTRSYSPAAALIVRLYYYPLPEALRRTAQARRAR
jgi:hypothetical protein